ncbi:MAG: dinitrogenase iron-molybdenum cofactor biosynthesis protein, partial [Thermodesulfobacteriota bacterium]
MTIIKFPNKNNSCCSGSRGRQARLTLPAAPRPFHRIRFDPIVSQSRAVPPGGALNWLKENLQQGAKIEVVDIDGPGDPLCEIDCTMETLNLVRREYPDIGISVTTLGVDAGKHAKPLAEAGVTEVALLVDAVEHKVAGKLYAWIRPGRKTIPLAQATKMLMGEQQLAVKAFKKV